MKVPLALIILLLTQTGCGTDMWLFRKKNVSLEQQVSQLEECGVRMNATATIDDLFIWGDRNDLESKPFKPLVEALASDLQREPFSPISDTLWMCDYERIEDHGAYVEVIERLERMTHNALNLSGISDHVDLDAGEAWVKFHFNDEEIRWEASVDDDWLDPYIIVKYDELLKRSGSSKRIYSNHTDYGQAALFAALSPAEFQCLGKLSPIKLEPLESQI